MNGELKGAEQGVTKPGLEHKSVWFRTSDLPIISPKAIVHLSACFAHLPLTADVKFCLGEDGVFECGLGHQAVWSRFQPCHLAAVVLLGLVHLSLSISVSSPAS